MIKHSFIRKLLVAACMFIAGSFVFAKEINLNYYMGEKSYNYRDSGYNAKIAWDFIPLGISLDTLFASKTKNVFQPGFDLDFGFFFAGNPTISGYGQTLKASGFLTMGQWISFSPSFGFNFGNNEIRLIPGVQLNLDEAFCNTNEKNETILDFYISLSLKAAYNFWFTESFGLNAGVDFDIPLYGAISDTVRTSRGSRTDGYDIGGGCDFRLFFGLSWK